MHHDFQPKNRIVFPDGTSMMELVGEQMAGPAPDLPA
jgi:hypothetical protein